MLLFTFFLVTWTISCIDARSSYYKLYINRLRSPTRRLFSQKKFILQVFNHWIHKSDVMPGSNCAFYGCPTNASHKLSLFRIPTGGASDTEHMKCLKLKTREEWIRLVTRTRESTPELRKRIETNKLCICELHFKPECILIGTYIAVYCATVSCLILN